MKKIFLCFVLLLLCIAPVCLPQTGFAESEPSNVYIVAANEAVVFATPSLSSNRITTLKHKDEIEIEFDGQSAKEYTGDGFAFFHVTTAEKEGYVISDLVVPETKFLVTIPQFNAKTNGKAKVYFFENGSYVPSDITLPKHQRIFLYQGFNSKKNFNAVAFVYDNEVVYGYLKKDDIDPDGVNPLIITVACFAIAAIGIILAFVFMKKKKKKTGISKKQSR